MSSVLSDLLDPSGLTPHGFCLAWDPRLLWLHAVGNALVALAYFSIPLALGRFVRARRDLAFPWVFWLFAAFILACGTTHLLGVVTLWLPLYWLDAGVMSFTAAISVLTAAMLWPLLPKALALPSPRQFKAANLALVAEIAERDSLAGRLRESEALFRAFFEHSTDLLAVIRTAPGDAARFEAANPALVTLLGREAASVPGQTLDAVMQGEHGAELQRHVATCIAQGEPLRYETRLVGADDRLRVFEAILVPVADPAGPSGRVMASLRDVTERLDLERKLVRSQKLEALGRMTGGIAHDFNNILMGLQAALRRIRQGTSLDTRLGFIVGAAEESVERGARLVRHMLAFASRQPLEPEELELNAIVGALAEEFVSRTLGGSIAVRTDLTPAPWPVLADRSQMEAALLNLAVNARDAMPDGGTLSLQTRNVRLTHPLAARLELADGEYVRVSVTDTGTGMPPEVATQAFDPFFTTKPLGQGTGLGLSQVYGFARQSGGAATLETALQTGTTVILYLPRTRAGDPTQVPPMEPGPKRP